jgi:hypothetical protein
MASSSHVGPIVFSNETARRQLVEEGTVTTFRASDRTTGETWWRKSRTGEKEGDVRVMKVADVYSPIQADDLAVWAAWSGFDTVDDWIDAIIEFHGSPVGDYDDDLAGHVYSVRLLSDAGGGD